MTPQRIIILALQASIFLTVFTFGLEAAWSDLVFVVRRPGLLARSMLALYVILPVVAFLLVSNFELRPPVEIALVALSLSPVPPVLPRKSTKAHGRTSYTLGLLVAAAVLSIVVIPVAVEVWRLLGHPFAKNPTGVALLAFKTVVLPLVAGMVFRSAAPRLAARIVRPVALFANVLLTLGAIVILVAAAPAVRTLIGDGTLIAMTVFVVAGLIAGHLLGGPDPDERVVLALCTACRHPGIALAIAAANYPVERLVGPAILLYVLVGTIVCIPYVAMQRRRLAAVSSLA